MKDIRVLVRRLLRPGPAGTEYGKDQDKQQKLQRKEAAMFTRERTDGTTTAAAQNSPAVSIAEASALCEASRQSPEPKRLTAAIPRHLRTG